VKYSITWVGIDDHKRELVVAVLRDSSETPEVSQVPNEDRALKRWIRNLVRGSGGGEIRLCYEAGPNGFALRRRLESFGPVICEVVAPSLTPRRPGERVKTDRRDAGKLVKLFRAGELTEIGIPSLQEEAARDLTRLRHLVTREKVRKQHHILRLLTRRGFFHAGMNWTRRHREWIQTLPWTEGADQMAFEELWSGLEELESRQRRLDQALAQLAAEESRALMVAVLRCFYGIDTVAAVSLVTEIFQIERFPSPRRLMSYLGTTSSVSQTGSREARGPVTKAGNCYARWMLVQIAWQYRKPCHVRPKLRQRREGQPVWAIEIAERARIRLHLRFRRLSARGKPTQKVVMAVARELIGFIWEAMWEVRRHETMAGRAA